MNLIIGCLIALNVAHGAMKAQKYTLTPESGKVVFQTKGWPNLVTIKGEGSGVKGTLNEKENKVSGDLVFDLTTLKTGIDLRDSHMKDNYLEIKKHPFAKLALKNQDLPKNREGSFDFKGVLSLHGVEKEVMGEAKLMKVGDEIKMVAELPIKISDFQIAIPSYQGITVAEKVTIRFESKVASI